MDPRDRHERLGHLFRAACQRPVDERSAFLDTLEGDDAALREELRVLLAEDADDAPFTLGADHASAISALFDDDDATTPRVIGRYRILRRIGVGGMGTVYEAAQDQPNRRVALKLIRPGMATPNALRRFELESELLGRLQHPGIAPIFDAGVFESERGAQPYLAMEYVDGQSLTTYVEASALNRSNRLELMARIADAVHHAHQRGVIHRDLKPANILVERADDATGRPRILDFGVARAMDLDGRATTDRTVAGQLVGTVPYMSPEQASGDVDAVDARSDVYALGVMTFEVLASRLPYDVRDKPLHDAVRIICEAPPTTLGTHDRTLRGDVETILAKALAKDPERRYQSARELADDLRRVLRKEPITARPPTAWYQLRTFARRHRAPVVAAALIVIALCSATAISLVMTVRAERAREAAQQEAVVSDEIATFLVDIFDFGDPGATRGNAVTAREVLDRGVDRIESALTSDQRVRAQLMTHMGTVYRGLSLYDESIPLLEDAVAAYQAARPIDHAALGEALVALGETQHFAGRYEDARAQYRSAIKELTGAHGENDLRTARAMDLLGRAERDLGAYDAAEAQHRAARIIREALVTAPHDALVESAQSDAMLLSARGQLVEAMPLLRETMEMAIAVRGPEHASIPAMHANYGQVLRALGRLDEAEAQLRRCVELMLTLYGEAHDNVPKARTGLASVLADMGRSAEAEAMLRQAVDGMRTLESNPVVVAYAVTALGMVLHDQGRLDEAIEQYEDARELYRTTLGPSHRSYATAVSNCGTAYREQGDLDRAAASFEEAVRVHRQVLGGRGAELGTSLWNLGSARLAQARFEDARDVLAEGYRILSAALGPEHQRTTTCRALLDRAEAAIEANVESSP